MLPLQSERWNWGSCSRPKDVYFQRCLASRKVNRVYTICVILIVKDMFQIQSCQIHILFGKCKMRDACENCFQNFLLHFQKLTSVWILDIFHCQKEILPFAKYHPSYPFRNFMIFRHVVFELKPIMWGKFWFIRNEESGTVSYFDKILFGECSSEDVTL